ncbi:MAG: DUF6580 family putative transport protein [Planctomycetota bacterium]
MNEKTKQAFLLLKKYRLEIVIFMLIVLLAAGSRFWLSDYPNFKPVAALALFAGFFFRRAWVAIAAIFSAMLISDMQIGMYEWQLAFAVYGAMAFSIALGVVIKKRLPDSGPGQFAGFAAASIAMSTFFFVSTNLVVWAMGMWYPVTADGLAHCFSAALPFYRYTLCGDLIFTTSIVAVWQVVLLVAAARGRQQSTSTLNI